MRPSGIAHRGKLQCPDVWAPPGTPGALVQHDERCLREVLASLGTRPNPVHPRRNTSVRLVSQIPPPLPTPPPPPPRGERAHNGAPQPPAGAKNSAAARPFPRLCAGGGGMVKWRGIFE